MPEAKDYKFNFKTRTIRDEAGNDIGKTKKQPSVVASIPCPTPTEIAQLLQQDPGSKEASLITDAVFNILVGAARDQFDEMIESFGEDESKEVAANMLDYDRISLTYVANLPATQRGGTALTEEDFENFFTDYMQVMVQATGKPEDKIKNHINLYKKPTKAKADKAVLNLLIEQLDIYLANSANLEDTGAAATRIRSKFERWAAEPEKMVNLDLL